MMLFGLRDTWWKTGNRIRAQDSDTLSDLCMTKDFIEGDMHTLEWFGPTNGTSEIEEV